MLNIIMGRAGAGKTAFVMNEIKHRLSEGEKGLLLIVPEQYSHDAERQLCRVCGDALSLHGETLSFSRLCNRVFIETGGAAENTLDKGGQMLVMRRAVSEVEHKLIAFGKKGHAAEFLEKLLKSMREMKSCGIGPEGLAEMSELTDGVLSEKLRDLSLIFGAYDSYFGEEAVDPSEKLDKLADKIEESSIGSFGHIYFDGFNDFTGQEMEIIKKLVKKGADMTFALTCEGFYGDDEIFAIPRKTAIRLQALAREYGVAFKHTGLEKVHTRTAALELIEKELFSFVKTDYSGECESVEIYAAPTVYSECEHAAKIILDLIRGGYRWRDIGVMSRDWAVYGRSCENVFEKYGIAYFSGGRVDILQKSPVTLIDAALDIAVSGWNSNKVFKYLKTGLTDISADDCSELENYVIRWSIRGSMWTRSEKWKLPPSGYGDMSEKDEKRLLKLDSIRRIISAPLIKLKSGLAKNAGVSDKLRVLYDFLTEIKLPERLSEKSELFTQRGDLQLAGEYGQLWDIIKNAFDLFYTICGDVVIDTREFRRLFSLLLSQYSVGMIPVSLDRVVTGDMLMCRRRGLKCLIVLGAEDGVLPKLTLDTGVFTPLERSFLSEFNENMPGDKEDQYFREMNAIYSTLTLPSEKLILTYSTEGGKRPSFIIKRICSMLNLSETTLSEDEILTAAPAPCYELAFFSGNTRDSLKSVAAREYFNAYSSETALRLENIDTVLRTGRGCLSPIMARRLYGENPRLSASRIENYYACAFAHFLQSGLGLKVREQKVFDAPEAGTFTHFILEGVSRAVSEGEGYKNADEELCLELTERLTEEYTKNRLREFDGKNERFRFLFTQLAEDTRAVVLDMLEELSRSDFVPLEFEFKFNKLPGEDFSGVRLGGIVDRVDGWEHEGVLYLRVIDYKTGKKQFSLSDVTNGLGMQMLIYLFALEKPGGGFYDTRIKPAGVLYVPSREVIIRAENRNISDDDIKKLREKQLRRGGLILDEAEVIEAMENGAEKKYLPVKQSKTGFGGDGLINGSQFEKLSEHVEKMLRLASGDIQKGVIKPEPFYKNDKDNACIYCDYLSVCAFSEETGDKRRYMKKKSADEVWEIIGGEKE